MNYNELKERIEKDKYYSRLNFETLCIPKVKELLQLKRIYTVENYSANETIKQLLDIKTGADYIGETQNGLNTVGIANRIQWAHPLKGANSWATPKEEWWPNQIKKFLKQKGFKTHTIRLERASGSPTEFEKRLTAIEKEYDFPVYTIQSYISAREEGSLLSIAIAKTRDLILFIKNGKQKRDFEIGNVEDNGAASFYYVYWERFITSHTLLLWPSNLIKKTPQRTLNEFIKEKTHQEV